jgi:hypothetical protein
VLIGDTEDRLAVLKAVRGAPTTPASEQHELPKCDLRHRDEPPVGVTDLAGAGEISPPAERPPVTSCRELALGLVLTAFAFLSGAGAAAVLASPPSAFEARPQAVWAVPPVLAR